jgi:hypothetical protein
MADHQNNDDEQQPPIWGSFHTLRDRYGIAPSTARVLIRKGAIEAVRLNNKTVRINLASVDRYFASMPKVEPGTGRWLGPERNRDRSPKRRRAKQRHGDLIKATARRKKPKSVPKGEIEEP